MSIFNSLGSNYNFDFVLHSIFTSKKNNLKKILEKKYGGQATLLFKGREAITLALKNLNLPKNSMVAVNGLTCYAVYRGIVEAGLKPVLIDISKDDLNFDGDGLSSALKKYPHIKVVIIQNTLGYSCDIEDISKICKEKKLFLIEDLAHSVGAKYKNRKETGGVGDMVILSFSQDKIIDGISGGALIIRNKNILTPKATDFKSPPIKKIIIDSFYPFLTLLVRSTYSIKVGKLFHYVLGKIGLLSSPMDDFLYGLTELPLFYQYLSEISIKSLESNLGHRKKIAIIYKYTLNKKILSDKISDQVDASSNLRFPIFVEKRDDLLKYLKNNGFHLSDIWYDAPVAPKSFMQRIDYKNDCPNAQEISEKILNLPTHINISEKKAKHLSKLINKWLK